MKIEDMTREQLLELVQRLPKTADWVPIEPGMLVYCENWCGGISCQVARSPIPRLCMKTAYTTHEAALSAARAQKGGGQ